MKTDINSKFLSIYLPLALFILSFVWKFAYINQRDLCLDEPFTVFNAQKSIGEILRIPAEGEPNPPLFMFLLHFWIKLFGVSTLSVRFLPLLFNSITILFLYYTGKRFFGLWTGIIGSGLFMLSGYHFFHGLEARTYALLSLTTASSLYFFFQFVQNSRSSRAITGLVVSNIIMVYSHYFGWFVVLSQIIASFVYIRSLKMFFRLMIPPLATLAGFLPMIPLVIRQFGISSKGTWLDPPGPHEFTDQLYHFLNHREVYRVLIYILAAGFLFSLFMLFRKKKKKPDPGILVLLLWWIVPYTIMFYVSSRIPVFNSRYVLFNTIGLFLTIGAFTDYLYQGNRYLKPLAALILLSFMFIHLKILPVNFGHREWKNSVEFVKKHENESSIIILFPKWSDYMFSYHYDRRIFEDHSNFNEMLAKKRIFSVWGIQHVRSIMAANPGKRIIYLQDGEANPGENVFGLLDSVYQQTESQLYPEMLNIRVYEPRPKTDLP
ncbi:MAG: glycosyltransferase family 39 protein [Bacteroidales bacterium]|nr:glycosyltransferase family 39 protein [Bacteroidales bacterium]